MSDAVEHTNCPLCGSAYCELVFYSRGFGVVKCSDCGHVYTSPRPAQSAMAKYYSDTDYTPFSLINRADSASFPQRMYKLFRRIHTRIRANKVLRNIGNHETPLILDVGCGTGELIAELNNRYSAAIGVDTSKGAVEYCTKNRLAVTEGGVENAEMLGARFDAVIFWHSLEHIHDANKAVEEAARMLCDITTRIAQDFSKTSGSLGTYRDTCIILLQRQ